MLGGREAIALTVWLQDTPCRHGVRRCKSHPGIPNLDVVLSRGRSFVSAARAKTRQTLHLSPNVCACAGNSLVPGARWYLRAWLLLWLEALAGVADNKPSRAVGNRA